MDNLSLYPPGVGPQDDFNISNPGKTKFYKDPRLSNQIENVEDKDKTNRRRSPSRSKRSEDRYEKRDRDRSSDRSPKRSRDRYGDRYDREDSYDRRTSHRSRRTPSPSSPQSKRSRRSRDSQQFDRRTYRDQPENSQFASSQVYNNTSYPPQQYTQAPPGYGNQASQFPAYMGASGNEAFMANSYMGANYITTAPPPPHPPPMMGPMISAPPPPPQPEAGDGQWASLQAQSTTIPPPADKIKREAAIASEKRQQRVTLLKQRDEYLRKVNSLKRELKVLKDQRNDLKGSSRTPPSPDTYRFLKENSKLQVEISNKLKTMNNVIDMLSGIIGEDDGEAEKIPSVARSPDTSPERSNKNGDSFSSDRSVKQNYNYIHYDPEMHWCQVCHVFPKTAKEYLQHLHDPEHILNVETGPGLEAPWHQILSDEDEEPTPIPGAITKRLPIRGLQHFTAATAWYCKLCSKWIGDLHCASAHLKSKGHAKSYTRFTEQNPHWETDWMADRQKAYERFCKTNPEKMKDSSFIQNTPSAADTTEQKSKKKHSKKEKKNKKKSKKHKKTKSSTSESSTDSESDSSDKLSEDKANSIRVTMRNKLKRAELLMQEKEANFAKWSSDKNEGKASPKKTERDDKMLMQWMANKGVLTESDKKMFEALRMRLKTKQEAEAVKEVEYEKVTPQPSVIPLIREQAEAAARKQREAEAEAIALKEREKYEAERENERRERERRDREKERDREYYKDRESRSYYRDRRRSPGDYRNTRYYDRRYSRSPDRRHYRSRSPEHRSRVEVGVITNPPPAPKPIKYEKKKFKNVDADSSDEKEKKFKQLNLQQQQQQQQGLNKKLPFIGRMPVFKSKPKDDSPKNDDDKKTGLEKAIQKRDEINAQIKKAMEDGTLPCSAMPMMMPFNNDDHMFADMAPPPPNISYEDPPIGFITPQQELPPGIESPSALDEIKIPINAAPPNKKLPKDFADALDIIFPGEKKADADDDGVPEAPPPPMDVMPMMVPYSMENQTYPDYSFGLSATGYEAPVSVPPPEEETTKEENVHDKKERPEMDDLAMLGIDESDITAQHF